MSVFTPAPTLRRRSQVVKVRSGSGSSHLCPRKTLTFILYMILSIGFILLIDNQRVLNTTDITISSFEKPSTHVRKSIPLDRSNQFVSVESSNGDELQLPAGLETTVGVGTSDVHIIIILIMIFVLNFSSHIHINLYIS